jgi:UDP-GlcNAc:undecaprenyl-phosphate GlcNAc-1-phosphate transferase
MVKIFTFLFVTVLNFFLIQYVLWISNKYSFKDYPESRKIHSKPTSYLGGVYLLTSLLIIFFFDFIFFKEITNFILVNKKISIIIFISTISYFFLGFIDDYIGISHFKKIILTLIINTIFFSFLPQEYLVKSFDFFLKKIYLSDVESILISIFFSSVFFFSLVIIDGINCLFLIFFLVLLILIQFLEKSLFSNFLLLNIFSTVVIFLYYNYKNKIFLGNNGSSFLGFVTFILILTNTKNNFFHINTDFNFYFNFYLIIFFDFTRLFFSRLLIDKKFFSEDNRHLHHLIFFKLRKRLILSLFVIIFILLFPTLVYLLLNNYSLTFLISLFFYLLIIKFVHF